MLLPPPDISAVYVDEKNRPSREFYNWIRSLYIFVGNLFGQNNTWTGRNEFDNEVHIISPPQSVTTASGYHYNSVNIDEDRVNNTGGSETSALYAQLVSGGTAAGQKISIQGLTILSGDTTTLGDSIGVQGASITSSLHGGTNTGAGAAGGLYGMFGYSQLFSGGLNYLIVSGAEFAAIMDAGTSSANRFGIDVIGYGVIRGAVRDSAIEIGASGANWNTGVMFSSLHGQPPVSTTGTLIGTDGASATVTNGIDFSAYTFSGSQIKLALGTSLKNAANDAAAAGLGVVVGEVYRNGSALMVRVV